MQKLKAGQNTTMDITRPSGAVLFTILVSLFTDGVSLTFTGHPILNRSFRNLAEGRAYLRYLKAEAAANTPLWLIVERAGAWTSAMAVADHAEQQLIDDIRATVDGAIRDTAAERPAVSVQPTNWHRMRAEIATTRTRVHTQPPTDAELARMRAHHNGRVTCDQGQPWTLLRGIVRRRYADPDTVEYVPGTRKIRAVWLNQRGWAAIGQQPERVAA